jgi:hypothetical protein
MGAPVTRHNIHMLSSYLELEGICRNPVFVIGSPRSGTTALGHALNEHPEFWASKESYVLHQLYGRGRADRVWQHHWKRMNPSWLRTQEVERSEFLGFLGLGLNALYTSRSGGRRWVDPTPLNTLMVDDLADMFPTASFLNLVRDGRFVVRSMGGFREMVERQHVEPIPADELPQWTGDFRFACETWAEYVETGRRFEAAHPERCLTIRNEDLAAEPDAGFARIHDFLGAGADDGPARFFAGARVNSSFPRSAKSCDSPTADWHSERRQAFAEIAGAALVQAGYASPAELNGWAASGHLEPASEADRR